jgi:hypothetical protein
MQFSILLIRSSRVEEFFAFLTQHNLAAEDEGQPPWAASVVGRFDIAGISITRLALISTEPPPEELEIPIEFSMPIPEARYCPECYANGELMRLPPQNRSGWCARHQDKNPERLKRKLKD